MDWDDDVCLCFRVSRRKLARFCERERPKVPSQLSACGGAGTGCGWCVPLLRKLWQAHADGTAAADLDALDAAAHAAGRAAYRAGRE